MTLRTASRFSKCSECTGFVNQLKASGTLEERDAIWTEWMPHLVLQSEERAAYHRRRQKAMKHPEWFLSVACDTMDGWKTELPRMFDLPKHITSDDLVHTKLHGVLVHGIGLWLHHIPPFIHCTANMVCSTLMNTLMAIPSEKRADRMYLQLDGASQNKCKTVLAFCSWLVKKGMFRQIKVSFLIVGHTHEDVDQCFCVISKHLRQYPAYTIADLQREVLAAFSKDHWHGNQFVARKISVHWQAHGANYDVKSWLEPYVDRLLSGFRFNANCMKFVMYEDSIVRMHYKQYASDPFWKPIVWDGDMPLKHADNHRLAGLPVQDTRHIVVMTGYPVGLTPPAWEGPNPAWLQEKPLMERQQQLIGLAFKNLIPRNMWDTYVTSWTSWFATVPHHLAGLECSTDHLPWAFHVLPMVPPPEAEPAVLARAVDQQYQDEVASSGLGEGIMYTGHSQAQEKAKHSGRVFKRMALAIPDGSLIALRKVRHDFTIVVMLTCM